MTHQRLGTKEGHSRRDRSHGRGPYQDPGQAEVPCLGAKEGSAKLVTKVVKGNPGQTREGEKSCQPEPTHILANKGNQHTSRLAR